MDHYRYVIAVLLFFGLVVTYMLRVNLSVAILAMVNNTALAEIEAAKNVSHKTEPLCRASDVQAAKQVSCCGFVSGKRTYLFFRNATAHSYGTLQPEASFLEHSFMATWSPSYQVVG